MGGWVYVEEWMVKIMHRREIDEEQNEVCHHCVPLTVVQTVQSQFCVTAPSWQTAGTTHGQQLLHCEHTQNDKI